MKLWYIARLDPHRYYLQKLSTNSDTKIYHWIQNRYRAMFFETELAIGGYINTYITAPRANINLKAICFIDGEEKKLISLEEFGVIYQSAMHQAILT